MASKSLEAATPHSRAEGSKLLAIVLETFCHGPPGCITSGSAEFGRVLEAMLALAAAHLMCHRDAELVVIAALPGATRVAYSTPHATTTRIADARAAIVSAFHSIATEQRTQPFVRAPVATSAAIGRALCFARRRFERDRVSSRVLLLKLGADSAAQYNAVMNCVFCAKSASVPLDACALTGANPALAKQAAHLTAGVFLHVADSQLQELGLHLLCSFAAAPGPAREQLALPKLDEADFRAACFCCKPPTVLDRGFVCSVCLAIYCDNKRPCACSVAAPRANSIQPNPAAGAEEEELS